MNSKIVALNYICVKANTVTLLPDEGTSYSHLFSALTRGPAFKQHVNGNISVSLSLAK